MTNSEFYILIEHQMSMEIAMMPKLLESCIKKYINDYEWSIDFCDSELGNGAYNYRIIKEKKNGKKSFN